MGSRAHPEIIKLRETALLFQERIVVSDLLNYSCIDVSYAAKFHCLWNKTLLA
jgi:hypothetical protein